MLPWDHVLPCEDGNPCAGALRVRVYAHARRRARTRIDGRTPSDGAYTKVGAGGAGTRPWSSSKVGAYRTPVDRRRVGDRERRANPTEVALVARPPVHRIRGNRGRERATALGRLRARGRELRAPRPHPRSVRREHAPPVRSSLLGAEPPKPQRNADGPPEPARGELGRDLGGALADEPDEPQIADAVDVYDMGLFALPMVKQDDDGRIGRMRAKPPMYPSSCV